MILSLAAVAFSVIALTYSVAAARGLARGMTHLVETEERHLATAWKLRDTTLIANSERRLNEQRRILHTLRRLGLHWIKPITAQGNRT
jgi:hypothetical protein